MYEWFLRKGENEKTWMEKSHVWVILRCGENEKKKEIKRRSSVWVILDEVRLEKK